MAIVELMREFPYQWSLLSLTLAVAGLANLKARQDLAGMAYGVAAGVLFWTPLLLAVHAQ